MDAYTAAETQEEEGAHDFDEGEQPLTDYDVGGFQWHIKECIAHLHQMCSVEYYTLEKGLCTLNVAQKVAEVKFAIHCRHTGNIVPGAATPTFPVQLTLRVAQDKDDSDATMDSWQIIECSGLLCSPLVVDSRSNKLFAPRVVPLYTLGALTDFLFLHLCVGMYVIRTLLTLERILSRVTGGLCDISPLSLHHDEKARNIIIQNLDPLSTDDGAATGGKRAVVLAIDHDLRLSMESTSTHSTNINTTSARFSFRTSHLKPSDRTGETTRACVPPISYRHARSDTARTAMFNNVTRILMQPSRSWPTPRQAAHADVADDAIDDPMQYNEHRWLVARPCMQGGAEEEDGGGHATMHPWFAAFMSAILTALHGSPPPKIDAIIDRLNTLLSDASRRAGASATAPAQ